MITEHSTQFLTHAAEVFSQYELFISLLRSEQSKAMKKMINSKPVQPLLILSEALALCHKYTVNQLKLSSVLETGDKHQPYELHTLPLKSQTTEFQMQRLPRPRKTVTERSTGKSTSVGHFLHYSCHHQGIFLFLQTGPQNNNQKSWEV